MENRLRVHMRAEMLLSGDKFTGMRHLARYLAGEFRSLYDALMKCGFDVVELEPLNKVVVELLEIVNHNT